MEKTSDGFECRGPRCGVTKMHGHSSSITEDDDAITIHIHRDKQEG